MTIGRTEKQRGMWMYLSISLSEDASFDDIRSLRSSLIEGADLRGRVRLQPGPSTPGAMGSVADTLAVVLAPGGSAAAIASVLVTWVRRRRGNIQVKITRPDTSASVEISASSVAGLDVESVRALVADISKNLTEPADADELER